MPGNSKTYKFTEDDQDAVQVELNAFYLTVNRIDKFQFQKATAFFNGNLIMIHRCLKEIYKLVRTRLIRSNATKKKLEWYKKKFEEAETNIEGSNPNKENFKLALNVLDEIDEELQMDMANIGVTWGIKRLRKGFKGQWATD